MYDVIVVGAGPAGSVAAKKCIENGLKTLLVDKRTLPRDKLCSGMLMGRMANELVQQEFGTIPENVLTTPKYLRGIMVHALGGDPVVVEQRMPFAWRRDLDFWMVQKAKQAGVELRDQARVLSVEQDGELCRVKLENEILEARFVVGADGSKSTVRKSTFPGIPVVARLVYRWVYPGRLSLDREYFHWIFPLPRPRPRFDVNHKGDCFIIEGGLRELKKNITQYLTPYGFSEEHKPMWKDGCISSSRLVEGFLSRPSPLARGNVLIAGDAAMLQYPVSGEGIAMALKSGLIAARSIKESVSSRGNVAEIYSRQMEPALDILRGLLAHEKKLEEAGKYGPWAVAKAFADGLRATFVIA